MKATLKHQAGAGGSPRPPVSPVRRRVRRYLGRLLTDKGSVAEVEESVREMCHVVGLKLESPAPERHPMGELDDAVQEALALLRLFGQELAHLIEEGGGKHEGATAAGLVKLQWGAMEQLSRALDGAREHCCRLRARVDALQSTAKERGAA